jgi:hypothetical protein
MVSPREASLNDVLVYGERFGVVTRMELDHVTLKLEDTKEVIRVSWQQVDKIRI